MRKRSMHWFHQVEPGRRWHLVETGGYKSECDRFDYLGPVAATNKFPNDDRPICEECMNIYTFAELAE
jgi:hypothetical protein